MRVSDINVQWDGSCVVTIHRRKARHSEILATENYVKVIS